MVCLLVEISRLCKNEKWAHSYIHLYSAFSPSSTKIRTGADLRSRTSSSAHFHLLRSPKPISNRHHKYRMSSGGYAASKEKKMREAYMWLYPESEWLACIDSRLHLCLGVCYSKSKRKHPMCAGLGSGSALSTRWLWNRICAGCSSMLLSATKFDKKGLV
jgi:hypothetical protein